MHGREGRRGWWDSWFCICFFFLRTCVRVLEEKEQVFCSFFVLKSDPLRPLPCRLRSSRQEASTINHHHHHHPLPYSFHTHHTHPQTHIRPLANHTVLSSGIPSLYALASWCAHVGPKKQRLVLVLGCGVCSCALRWTGRRRGWRRRRRPS